MGGQRRHSSCCRCSGRSGKSVGRVASGRRGAAGGVGAEAAPQAQECGGLPGPGAGAIRTIAAEREPDGGDFGFGLPGVEELRSQLPASGHCPDRSRDRRNLQPKRKPIAA